MNANDAGHQERTREVVEAHFTRLEHQCLKHVRWMLLFAILQCAAPILFVVVLYRLEAKLHLVQALCFGLLVGAAVHTIRRYEHSRMLYLKVRNRDF